MNPNSPKPSAGKAGWEMRFEKFNVQWEKEGFLSMDELKSFIASELAREREKIAKMIEVFGSKNE